MTNYIDSLIDIEPIIENYYLSQKTRAKRSYFWDRAAEGILDTESFYDGYRKDLKSFHYNIDAKALNPNELFEQNTYISKLKDKSTYAKIKDSKDYITNKLAELEANNADQDLIDSYKDELICLKALSRFWGLQFKENAKTYDEISMAEWQAKNANKKVETEKAEVEEQEIVAEKTTELEEINNKVKERADVDNAIINDSTILDKINDIYSQIVKRIENKYINLFKQKLTEAYNKIQVFENKTDTQYLNPYISPELDSIKYFLNINPNLPGQIIVKTIINNIYSKPAYATVPRWDSISEKIKPTEIVLDTGHYYFNPSFFRVTINKIFGVISYGEKFSWEEKKFNNSSTEISTDYFNKTSELYDPELKQKSADFEKQFDALLKDLFDRFEKNVSSSIDKMATLSKEVLAKLDEGRKAQELRNKGGKPTEFCQKILDIITDGQLDTAKEVSIYAGTTDGSEGAAQAMGYYKILLDVRPYLAHCNWQAYDDQGPFVWCDKDSNNNELTDAVEDLVKNKNNTSKIEILPDKHDHSDALITDYYKD